MSEKDFDMAASSGGMMMRMMGVMAEYQWNIYRGEIKKGMSNA